MRTARAVCLLLVLPLPLAAASDLDVGPQGSGATFTSIGAAIVAAQPGDRVLVRAGVYVENVWITKPIELIGAGSGVTRIEAAPFSPAFPTYYGSPLTISGIGAGERARAVGLELRVEGATVEGLLTHVVGVVDCPGLVELADLRASASNVPGWEPETECGFFVVRDSAQVVGSGLVADGPGGTTTPILPVATHGMLHQGFHGALVIGSAAWFSGCDFRGRHGQLGGDGLRAVDALLHVADSALWGAFGSASSVSFQLGRSGSGLVAEGTHVLLAGGSGSACVGGDASVSQNPFFPTHGLAGHGVALDGTSSLVHASDVELTSGAAAGNLAAGDAIHAAPGATATLLARHLPSVRYADGVVAAFASVDTSFEGEPGAILLRAVALSTGPWFQLPLFDGALLLDLGSLVHLAPVVLDGAGQATSPTTAPGVPGLAVVQQVLQLSGTHLDFSPPALLAIAP